MKALRSRRRCVLLGTAAVLLTNGIRPVMADDASSSEERAAAGFDQIVWRAVGELVIEQGAAERVRVEAERAVLPKIRTVVRDSRLVIDLAPGSLSTQVPIRVKVTVRTLRALDADGSGSVHVANLRSNDFIAHLGGSTTLDIAAIDAQRFELRMAGAGETVVGGGSVESQSIHIEGSGAYDAPKLNSRRCEIRITGSGSAKVAASEALAVAIVGSGDVRYHGEPTLAQQITGAGSVERERD